MTRKKTVKRKSKYSMGKALLIAQAEARVKAAAKNSMSEPEAWKAFSEATAALGIRKPVQTVHQEFKITATPEQAVKIAEAVRRYAAATNGEGQPKATRFDTAGIEGERAHQFAEEQFRAYNRADVKDDPFDHFNAFDRLKRGQFMGHVEGYDTLSGVLTRAYEQAARGKGYDRHGRGAAFDVQPTQVISSMLDTDAGLAFQAIKKVNEGMRLEHDAKIKEMLGAINYIASIVIYMEAKRAS